MTILPMSKPQSHHLPRQGETTSIPIRSKRFYAHEAAWYFNTRDDQVQGPFKNLGEAKARLKVYLRRCGIVNIGG